MIKKRFFAFIFSLLLFVTPIIALEVIAYFIYENYYKSDDLINPLYWNSFIESVRKPYKAPFLFPLQDDSHIQRVYKDAYRATIKNGVRFTPGNNLDGSKHFLFLGCSFTFGVGVKDNETLPYYFSKKVKDSRVYNFGLPGLGPAETLTLLRRKPFYPNYEEIKNLPVIGVFTFFPDHINRTALNFSHLLHSPLDMIVEYRLQSGKIMGGQYLSESNYPKFVFYHALKRSKLLRIFMVRQRKKWEQMNAKGIFEEQVFSKKDTLLTLKMMETIEAEFKKLFPNGHFYVFTIAPNIGFIEKLAQAGVSTFGAENTFATSENLPDGHFNPKGLSQLAEFVITNLKQKGVLSDQDLKQAGDNH